MNCFDRFSRQFSARSESPFRNDASPVRSPASRPSFSCRAASASFVASRSVYRLSCDASADASCVSVADDALPPPVESAALLPASFSSSGRGDFPPSPSLGLAGLTLPQIERAAFLETLVACNGCRRLAARKLGVSEKTMYNKIKQYKLGAELERLKTDLFREPAF